MVGVIKEEAILKALLILVTFEELEFLILIITIIEVSILELLTIILHQSLEFKELEFEIFIIIPHSLAFVHPKASNFMDFINLNPLE